VNASGWHAARHGVDGTLVDPRHGTPAEAARVVAALLDHIAPALTDLGDLDRVGEGVARLLDGGTGAVRQRRAAAEGGLGAVLDLVAPAPLARPVRER
jgi:glutamate---cysteine ligase / carboxylate-amine ligase